MTLAAPAFAAAVLAGSLAFVLAARGLRAPSRSWGVAAAVARGAAVALAVLAAFGPVHVSERTESGESLVAAPGEAEVPARDAPTADATVRWSGDAPDAAAALETLRAMRDAQRPAALALIATADPRGTRDPAALARALRRSPDVDPYVLDLPPASEPSADLPPPRILAPGGATEGVRFSLTLDAGDAPFEGGEATVTVEGREMPVAIPAGARRAVTPALTLAAGSHLVAVRTPGRPPAVSIVEVGGAPRVLVVHGADTAAHELAGLLRTQGLEVADVSAAELAAEDLERASVIVLGAGVAGDAAVAARVRAGAGLLCVGGEGASGLARFFDGPLAKILPVEVPAPAPPAAPPAPPAPEKRPDPKLPKPALDLGEKKALRVALLLVIDTSGSMAGAKLEMAQRAAIAATRSLAPEDRVSVVSFDDDAHEVAAFQDAANLNLLERRIAGLAPGGGTNFFPALRLGFGRILAERCGIRHVVLLTDGATEEALFGPLVEEAAGSGVTLSTIAIGDDADTSRLAQLASWGHGKLYVADDPSRLPQIVTLDTNRFAEVPRRKERAKLDPKDLPEPPAADAKPPASSDASSPPADTEPPVSSRPRLVSDAAFLGGIEPKEWPLFEAIEKTPASAASQVVLAYEDGSPALTLGRAGLGRVAVISAAVGSPAARDFRRWSAAPQFLAQLVRGLAAPPKTGERAVDVHFVEGEDGRAFARVDVAGGGVLLLDPVGAGGPLVLHLVDRGGFSQAALAVLPPAGAYAGTFARTSAPADEVPRRAIAVSRGPRASSADTAHRAAAAARCPTPDRLPAPRDGAPVREEIPAELPFVGAAAGLLVVEAALRRLARRFSA